MKKSDVVRAWKDRKYRSRLSASQQASLPANPAGDRLADIDEESLRGVSAGAQEIGRWSPDSGRVCTLTAECLCPDTVWGSCLCCSTSLPF